MGSKTGIQWAWIPGYEDGGTYNPWHAFLKPEYAEELGLDPKRPMRKGWYCEKVKGRRGCAHCYAAAWNIYMGTGLDYAAKYRHMVDIKLDALDVIDKKRKPTSWFVDSMTDMFGDFYPDSEIAQVIDRMIAVPRHLYIILTKRHERMSDFLHHYYPDIAEHRNIWWGISCEDQDSAEQGLISLLQTPAACRVVSYEPAVGRVNWDAACGQVQSRSGPPQLAKIPDWILIGGESEQRGFKAAPFEVEWALSTIDWCRRMQNYNLNCAPFLKQLGSAPMVGGAAYHTDTKKGGEISEWPPELQVREFPMWVMK